MGIQDREYYKDEASGYQLAVTQWTMVTKLIVVTAAFYVVDLFIGNSHWLMRHMAAESDSLLKPLLWWQWLTYGFAHSTKDISHIFWNMFGLWIFGRQVEGIYGPREFLRIYLVSMVFGGFIWSLRSVALGDVGTLVGASGAVTAITLLFCIHYPKQTVLLMMVLPVPAWVLGVLIIAGNLMGMRASGEHVAFDVHLAGALFAIVYYRFGWRLSNWIPSLPGFARPRSSRGNSRGWWPFKAAAGARPPLRVHRPLDEEDPESTRDTADDDFSRLEAQADQLLQKIKDRGIDSLSARERRVLDEYSRRMRER